MFSTISPQDGRQSAPGDTMRHDSIRGVVTTWGPLALFSVAFAYACAGVVLQSGALPTIYALAAPFRPIAIFLVAASPMLLAVIAASLQRGSCVSDRAIRAFGICISLPALAIATVWFLG